MSQALIRHSAPGAADLGAMELTKRFLRAKNPCANGFRWFVRHIEDGASYQQALDTLVQAGRVEDACWLLQQFGPTDAVLTLEHLEADAVVFAGSLQVKGNIEVGSLLRTGHHVRAGGSVRVGQQLLVGGDLWSEGGVRSEGRLQVNGDMRVAGACRPTKPSTAAASCAWAGTSWLAAACRSRAPPASSRTCWCSKASAADRGLRVGGLLHSGHSVQAEQGILVGQDIECGMHLEAGWGIRAGGGISAQGSIKAGESLQAGSEICAGQGYGIYAGLSVPMDTWGSSGHVLAARRPEGLLSGHWTGTEQGSPSQLFTTVV